MLILCFLKTKKTENTTDKTITWETDQPEVITIDETGLVTAKTNGTAKITAKITNGIKAELTVTVEITSEETTPPEETSPCSVRLSE